MKKENLTGLLILASVLATCAFACFWWGIIVAAWGGGFSVLGLSFVLLVAALAVIPIFGNKGK